MSPSPIDLRSDTVTQPSPAMREAMARAKVGDDVWGDDPTVNALQDRAAELLRKQAALYLPSGTQSNLAALMSHCGRGDEYIVGEHAHTYMYEGGGAAVLGSIQPQPVPTLADGMMCLASAAAAVKRPDDHFARTRLICLENTTDGRAVGLAGHAEFLAFAAERDLATHLDGARLANAAVAQGASLAEMAAGFDSVSLCLSKGLGAPVGSVLAGSAELITQAHRWRKVLGGGMRQAGIIAAAGLYALTHNVERLADDHANAARLAEGLGNIDGLAVQACDTNMVFVALNAGDGPGSGDRSQEALIQASHVRGEAMEAALAQRGVATSWHGLKARLVTHLDVTDDDVEAAIGAFGEAVKASS